VTRGLAAVELGDLGFAEGAHLLVKRALAGVAVGAAVDVAGSAPTLAIDLPAWCRGQGHRVVASERHGAGSRLRVERGGADAGRWRGAERAGASDPGTPGAVADAPPPRWGLAARGAMVEAGSPAIDFALADKRVVWADEAARLYGRAVAAQWDPATAIVWDRAELRHPAEVEAAVVQLMTYLIENETAALVVPARFLGQIHPHFREVMQLLAVQVADEARHIEVFTRRAQLGGCALGRSSAGGQASLATLLDEPDFAIAGFLLSVLGEGSFLDLLWFLRDHAPDPVTRDVARLAAQDEARHVAFGLAHLARHVELEPALRPRLAAAVERRHAALSRTAGLDDEVFDSLVLLAAGSWAPADLRRGHAAVVALVTAMDTGRRQRLARLGFTDGEAAALSALHTRNFM
jgi:TusA-related sulfurtransferase